MTDEDLFPFLVCLIHALYGIWKIFQKNNFQDLKGTNQINGDLPYQRLQIILMKINVLCFLDLLQPHEMGQTLTNHTSGFYCYLRRSSSCRRLRSLDNKQGIFSFAESFVFIVSLCCETLFTSVIPI